MLDKATRQTDIYNMLGEGSGMHTGMHEHKQPGRALQVLLTASQTPELRRAVHRSSGEK